MALAQFNKITNGYSGTIDHLNERDRRNLIDIVFGRSSWPYKGDHAFDVKSQTYTLSDKQSYDLLKDADYLR